jgi:hypothetical protein
MVKDEENTEMFPALLRSNDEEHVMAWSEEHPLALLLYSSTLGTILEKML